MHDNAIRGVEADGGAIGEDKTKTREEEVPREGNRAECDDEGRCGQSGEGDKEGPRRHPPTRHGEVLGGHAGEMVEVEPVLDQTNLFLFRTGIKIDIKIDFNDRYVGQMVQVLFIFLIDAFTIHISGTGIEIDIQLYVSIKMKENESKSKQN